MKILYEDAWLLAVEKPQGMPIQPDKTGEEDLWSYLCATYATLGLIHRLDRPVGGVALFAKTKEAEAAFSAALQQQLLEKEYLAVVQGSMSQEKGSLTDWLKKNARNNLSQVVSANDKNAKKAVLSYRQLQKEAQTSLLHIRLLTGRHHQIRVQLSHAGCPILGDRKYGATAQYRLPYPALWCCRMGGVHPMTKQPFSIISLPDMQPFSDFSVLTESGENILKN